MDLGLAAWLEKAGAFSVANNSRWLKVIFEVFFINESKRHKKNYAQLFWPYNSHH